MFAALDVHYDGTRAVTGAVLFDAIDAACATEELTVTCSDVADYQPGEFFRRELPCLMAAIERIHHPLRLVFVDAFVFLGAEGTPGLGWHLHRQLGERVAVVGVAKKPFHQTPRSHLVLRGSSKQPLFVTSIGVDLADAQSMVRSMHGSHRVPTLLRRVDRLAREGDRSLAR